jgi:acyl-CoA thioesterase FadM
MPSREDYRWVIDIHPEAQDYDELGHVGNAAVARFLDTARTEWFRSLPGREPGRHVVVRHVSISYENEALPEQRLRCGVRAVSRSARSITVDQLLWRADDELAVAFGTAVHVCFELATRSAVEVWPAMAAAIQERQGEPLASSSRQVTEQ